MFNILVTGANGQLGSEIHELSTYYPYQFFFTDRAQLDISDEKAVVSMIRTVKKEFGKIDILINNAGIASMNHILTTSVESISKLFNTNFIVILKGANSFEAV
jgi:NAD(P)-dependent dehydrogenase (short-subunit alcohol dehydrogenase family)